LVFIKNQKKVGHPEGLNVIKAKNSNRKNGSKHMLFCFAESKGMMFFPSKNYFDSFTSNIFLNNTNAEEIFRKYYTGCPTKHDIQYIVIFS